MRRWGALQTTSLNDLVELLEPQIRLYLESKGQEFINKALPQILVETIIKVNLVCVCV